VYQQGKDDSAGEGDRAEDDKDRELPPLKKGMDLTLLELSPRQHFTQPPAAFNEASLIKELEEKGIGRPSTYAEIVSTIQKRKYVELEAKKFRPTILGRIIAGLLVDSFPRLLDPAFTAEMESTLDLIEEGNTSWTETLERFYGPFLSALKRAEKEMKSIKRDGIPTMESCPECGERLLLRSGRFGMFMGCPAYPDCEYTCNVESGRPKAAEPIPTDKKCPECGAPMVIRDGRTGPFIACSRYPECRKTLPVPTGVECPKCGKGKLAQRRSRRGKTFYSCDRYPDCDYSLWNKPVSQACPNPDCDSPLMEERSNKTDGRYLQCPKCKHKVKATSDEAAKEDGIGA
jgi:DNA topoisomerase-1